MLDQQLISEIGTAMKKQISNPPSKPQQRFNETKKIVSFTAASKLTHSNH